MDFIELLPVFMFLALALLLFSGYPVAFVLGGVGLFFGFIGIQLEVFSLIEFFNILSRIWGGVCENLILVAIPIINILVVPSAVIGATILWCENSQDMIA